MKFFVALALVVAVASAGVVLPAHMPAAEMAEIQEIVAAINSPNTDPATAVLLEQMLLDLLGVPKPEPSPAVVDEYEPIHVGPAIIEDYHPIQVGPAFVEDYHPIQVEPALVDEEYQDVVGGPAIIDFPVPVEAVTPTPAPSSSPLVQIIVNVEQSQPISAAVPLPALVSPPRPPKPVLVDNRPVIKPTPVLVAENAIPDYEPVLIADLPLIPEPVIPEPILVAPIDIAPVEVAPETLN